MNYKKWKPEEIKYIEENQALLSDKELASSLSKINQENITVEMIRRQRRNLNIKKKQGRRKKAAIPR